MSATDNFRAAPEALPSQRAEVQAWVLVQVGDAEAIDVFLSRDKAEDALAECLYDEPEWQGLLRIEEIELAGAVAHPRCSYSGMVSGTASSMELRSPIDKKAQPQ